MKRLLLGVLLAILLAACDDANSTGADSSRADVRDSVVVVDSLRLIDSVRVKDSLKIVDSVLVRDSLKIKDSVNVIDSVRIIDSLNIVDSIHVIDSLHIIDSVHVIDSVKITEIEHDTLVVHDVEFYLGECTEENSSVIKSVEIKDEERSFVCDRSTLLWQIANAVDSNNMYIVQSAVTDFVDLETVVQNLAEGEKLVIVLRHAERGDKYGMMDPLNENGFEQSEELGKTLAGETPFYYGASQFVRAHQTCNKIAGGRGETGTLADTIAELNDDWFVKDKKAYDAYKDGNGGSWKVASRWLYESAFVDAFYGLAERSTELLDGYLIPALEKSEKSVGLFVSHDLVMVPLVAYVSSKSIDLKYYSTKQWLNYLAGIAVVIKPDGIRVFYAVQGLESGIMKK